VFKQSTRGEGRFIRQNASGGSRYGHIILQVDPHPGGPFAWSWEVPESEVPARFEPWVLQGIHKLFEPNAKFGGCELSGFSVRVVGGSFHETDSSEMAFTAAGAFAFQDALEQAGGANAV